eukprot:SM000245S08169  [mRNA]  locus=s245:102638:105632:+ [translate_table: standard]
MEAGGSNGGEDAAVSAIKGLSLRSAPVVLANDNALREHLKSAPPSPPRPSLDEEADAELKVWRANPFWVDEVPSLKVSVPRGQLCRLDCSFKIGLPPTAVYDILVRPDNTSVFKSIKAVKSRTVLEDDGNEQLVEIEQSAIWRFLMLSGTFDVKLLVKQNRQTKHIQYKLAQAGFMKSFEGTWKIEPYVLPAAPDSLAPPGSRSSATSPPAQQHISMTSAPSGIHVSTTAATTSSTAAAPHHGGGEAAAAGDRRADLPESTEAREQPPQPKVASVLTLSQVVQPSIIPPPPISWYIRGITADTTRTMLADLQAAARRIREGQVAFPQAVRGDSPTSERPHQSNEAPRRGRDGDSEEMRGRRRTHREFRERDDDE